ncbi:MAG: DUF58 domain-containing protein [Gemmataceae bacterium]|nr:DUF58 domain-containing protein [Gemmataceae bacterium]
MLRWLIAAVLLVLAGLAIESGLLAYAGYVLLALIGVSRWLARSWVEGLTATRKVSAADDGLALEIGGRFTVEVTVANEGTLPVPWVLVEDNLPSAATDPRFPKLKVKGRRIAVAMLAGKGETALRYEVECLGRGFHQVGPVVLESGDLFGLHRRFRVLAPPKFVLVYPRIVPLSGYDIASRRPIGDVRMTYRLFEDPTRIAGVREYQAGDPLSRVHWKATARTGALHSKVHEPSTLSGITVLLDFRKDSFHARGEPMRSELAVTVAVSLAYAVYLMGQQVGLVTNARDAAERIKTEGWDQDPRTRQEARAEAAKVGEAVRIEPLVVETGRGPETIHRIRETLARAELAEGLAFAGLVTETAHRLPRDATAMAVLSEVTVEHAIALGNLRRRGMAVAVILVQMDEDGLERAYARLVAEGIRELRHCPSEEALPDLCSNSVNRIAPYDFA